MVVNNNKMVVVTARILSAVEWTVSGPRCVFNLSLFVHTKTCCERKFSHPLTPSLFLAGGLVELLRYTNTEYVVASSSLGALGGLPRVQVAPLSALQKSRPRFQLTN